MEARFRQDYDGEFVVVKSIWAGGKKIQEREWIANPITNQHISGRAACICSNTDLESFDYTILARHRGGLLGSKKLQTYGTGEITKKMNLDFSVELNQANLAEIIQRNYHVDNIVYTSARQCIASPGNFYLIPFNPNLLEPAAALYLAAFDGHQEIFLLGYNKETPIDSPFWIDQVTTVINTYRNVIFYLIGVETNMPESWRSASNTKCLNYRDFIGYCDV